MEHKGGNEGRGPVKEQNKTKTFSLLDNVTSSFLGVNEIGTELCPLHHIRQCFKRYYDGAEAPTPPSIICQLAFKSNNNKTTKLKKKTKKQEMGQRRMDGTECVEFK